MRDFQVENLVAIELAYINTKHPDFHKDAALVSSLLKNAEMNQPKQNRRLHSTALSTATALMPGDGVSIHRYLMKEEVN